MYAYFLFNLNNWVGRLSCVDRIVPVAIHNPVAIKLLLFGLLYLTYTLYTPVFSFLQVLYLYLFSSVLPINKFNIFDRGGCHT